MSTPMNSDDYLDLIHVREGRVTRSVDEKKAREKKGVTDQHHQRGEKIEESFLQGIAAVGKCSVLHRK